MHYKTFNASKPYPLDPLASIHSNIGFSGRHLFTFLEISTTVEISEYQTSIIDRTDHLPDQIFVSVPAFPRNPN